MKHSGLLSIVAVLALGAANASASGDTAGPWERFQKQPVSKKPWEHFAPIIRPAGEESWRGAPNTRPAVKEKWREAPLVNPQPIGRAAPASGLSGWTAVCDRPVGAGFEFGDLRSLDGSSILDPSEGFKSTEDTFSGVFPVVLFAGGDAKYVTVIWGNTRPDKIPPEFFRKPSAQREIVLTASADRVATISLYPSETWMSTYYPLAGVAYATRHKTENWETLGFSNSATTFTLNCSFTASAR